MDVLDKKKKIVVVCGPTATGKSSLALKLCKRFKGELVNADSMQIYKGLVVGTAALTERELGKTPIHISGFLEADMTYSVAQYTKQCHKTINDINSRKMLPILCGGTGLYISSVVNGISFTDVNDDNKTKNMLEDEWEKVGAQAMHDKLKQLDPAQALKLDVKDRKRIIRAIEMFILTAKKAEVRENESLPEEMPYNSLIIGTNYSSRDKLYDAINNRVDKMLEKGLLKEAEYVYENRDNFKTAVQAIGYKEFFPFFRGDVELNQCIDTLKQATRNYAKRQITWFKKLNGIQWVNVDSEDFEQELYSLAESFLR